MRWVIYEIPIWVGTSMPSGPIGDSQIGPCNGRVPAIPPILRIVNQISNWMPGFHLPREAGPTCAKLKPLGLLQRWIRIRNSPQGMCQSALLRGLAFECWSGQCRLRAIFALDCVPGSFEHLQPISLTPGYRFCTG